MSSADEAMSQYAQGNTMAFAAVYDAIAPRLETYLRRQVRERGAREDIVQQTFLHMHSGRGTFIQGSEVMPWAFAIARRLVIDMSRKTRRENQCDMMDDLPATVSRMQIDSDANLHTASSEALVEAQEVSVRVSAAYAALSEPQRAAYDLVKREGMSHAQAALVLGTTVTGVKLRVHRAYLALRKALADAPPPASPAIRQSPVVPVRASDLSPSRADPGGVKPVELSALEESV